VPGPWQSLGRLFHFLAQFGAAHLGLGIEVGHPGHLNFIGLEIND
jgi:hypothetical protein